MSELPENDKFKQYQRFMDIEDEPLITMTPIRGYEKMPLVSLEEAVKPLIPCIPEVEHMVDIVRKRCKNPPPNQLTLDQSAAIMLYTMEWEPKESSVYYILNKALRTEDRQVLKPWFLYLKLLFTALSLLPSDKRLVFRGVRENLKTKYRKGEKVIWWGFSSCTLEQEVLSNETFMGLSGRRTMFTIESESGKDIKQHSYFKSENEVLLPAAREFEVKSVFPQADGLCLVHLIETQPKYPLLETDLTMNKNAPKTSSSKVHPVLKQPVHKSHDESCHIDANQSAEQGDPVGNDYGETKHDHRLRWYLGVAYAFIFCCPCTSCYFLCKILGQR